MRGAQLKKSGPNTVHLRSSKPATYSVPEAGRILGLGKNASYEAAHRGELPVLRFGRKLRVPRAALEKMLGQQ
jgi:excisionase family DNA binding protein